MGVWGMMCPACGAWSKILQYGRTTTGRRRLRQCLTCGLQYTTYQGESEIETVALRLNKPTPPQVAEQQEELHQDSIAQMEEWDKKRHEEWLSDLVSQVERNKGD